MTYSLDPGKINKLLGHELSTVPPLSVFSSNAFRSVLDRHDKDLRGYTFCSASSQASGKACEEKRYYSATSDLQTVNRETKRI